MLDYAHLDLNLIEARHAAVERTLQDDVVTVGLSRYILEDGHLDAAFGH